LETLLNILKGWVPSKPADSIQLLATILTLVVGIGGFIFSSVTSKKTRRANIVSVRRKERMENLILYYSEIVSMCHLNSLENSTPETFYKDILRLQNNFTMSLNLSFEKDVALCDNVKEIVNNAIILFEHRPENDESQKYQIDFVKRKNYLEFLLNMHLSTEWGRIQLEAEKGKKVDLKKWTELYIENVSYYDKWNSYNQHIENISCYNKWNPYNQLTQNNKNIFEAIQE